jgi:hypothetical protein
MKISMMVPGIALAALASAAQAAPASVQSLYDRIPEPPASAAEAAKWFDKSQQLVHPGLIALKKDIDSHQQAVAELARPLAEKSTTEAGYQVESLGKGMADVGIDMQRMSTDPAYAAQVQERMKKMSPAELMAMSQKMNKPMQQDKRITNQAKAMVDDPPAVREAAEVGYAYSSKQVERMQAFGNRWKQTDAAVDKIYARGLPDVGQKKPTMEYDNIGCDKACEAAWNGYAAKVLPLMIARDTEILQVRRAALLREKAAIANDIKTADKHLLATQFGGLSQSQANQSRIHGLDGAALSDILLILERLESSVRDAAIVTNCGPQTVKVPQAVCQ